MFSFFLVMINEAFFLDHYSLKLLEKQHHLNPAITQQNQLALPISFSMPKRWLLPSPEKQANTKTTQGNYPPLVYLFLPHQKTACGK